MSERFYWKCRLVAKGPEVPVVTFYGAPIRDGEEQDRSHSWQCLVRNETTSRKVLFGDECPIEIEGTMLRNLESITEEEHRFLCRHHAWATAHAPHHPHAAPRTPIERRGKSIW